MALTGETGLALSSGREAVEKIFSGISYQPAQDITFDEWTVDVFVLCRWGGRVQFYIGDAIIFGQKKFGESYSQALNPDDLGMEMQTIYNYVWVCRAIPPERRRGELSWEHHKLVAAQPPDLQDYWLARAAEEHMSTRELRDAIRGKLPGEEKVVDFARTKAVLLGEFLMMPMVSEEQRDEWLGGLTNKEREVLAGEMGQALLVLENLSRRVLFTSSGPGTYGAWSNGQKARTWYEKTGDPLDFSYQHDTM